MQLLVVVLVAVAAGALGVGVVVAFRRPRDGVSSHLRDYHTAAFEGQVDDETEYQFAETGVLQGAVDATGRWAERAGLLERVESSLERADLPLRAAEAMFFYVAGVLVLGLSGFAISGRWFVGVVVLVVAAVAPLALISARQRKRLATFEEELPGTLNLLAGSLRAGFSFQQALEAVSQEVSGPLGAELQRVFNEVQLGRTLEDALDDAAERMESDDLEWTVLAVRIQREAGGNLAELLDTVAETMSQRERLRAEIRTLTAEGRLSGIVLGIFPFAFAGILAVISPDYLDTLFSETAGIVAVAVAGGLALVGFLWLRKIVTIEV